MGILKFIIGLLYIVNMYVDYVILMNCILENFKNVFDENLNIILVFWFKLNWN